MSQYVPDWNVEDESRFFRDLLPITNQKLSTGAEDELVELLWQNGHVVMHSQSQRKSPTTFSEFKQVQKPEQVQRSEQSMGNPSNVIQDDDTASWFQYPVDDSLDKEFCSEFFFEMAGADVFGSDRISKDVIEDQERYVKFGACNDNNLGMSSVPGHCIVSEKISPPNLRSSILGSSLEASCLENDGVVNFSHFTRSAKVDLESSNCQFNVGSGSGIKLRVQEPSMMTIGSSNCGSNQIPSRIDRSHAMSSDTTGGGAGLSEENGRIRLPTDIEMTNAHETTTTSSGGSGCSIGRSMRQRKSNQSQKRKGRDVEDFECQSEDNDHGKRITKKPAQKSTSTRRSRAAEVHNLSERRRRDRINEKMKALQELIPHCNKADKASMLDEAIEYLKTLQLQVQMMWMGGGMAAPMMFPGMQQYISAMGMGMAPASLPSMASAVQMPRVPFINQTMTTAHARNQAPMYPSLSMPPVNFSNSMQGIHQPEPYAFLGFPHLQPQTQQNQPAVASHTGSLPNAGERAPTKGENRSGILHSPCSSKKLNNKCSFQLRFWWYGFFVTTINSSQVTLRAI